MITSFVPVDGFMVNLVVMHRVVLALALSTGEPALVSLYQKLAWLWPLEMLFDLLSKGKIRTRRIATINMVLCYLNSP
jgi:hypothetical protein